MLEEFVVITFAMSGSATLAVERHPGDHDQIEVFGLEFFGGDGSQFSLWFEDSIHS